MIFDNVIPSEVLMQVLYFVDTLCTKENNYTFITFIEANNVNYKLTIQLYDVDGENKAKSMSIIAKKEDTNGF
jgi:hypothetical protein